MRKILFFFVAFAACVSCLKDDDVILSSDDVQEYQTLTLRANAPVTKTQLEEGTNVKWSPNDAIKVCFEAKATWNKEMKGEVATLTSTNTEVSESASFIGQINTSNILQDYGLVLYPETFVFDSYTYNKKNYYKDLSTTISYNIPSAQEPIDNSFAPNINPSWASVSKKAVLANNPSVTFKNLASLIKITLPSEDKDVRSIQIESENTALTGERSMNWTNSYNNQSLAPGDYVSQSNEVTLMSGAKAFAPGVSYFAVVWPGDAPKLNLTFKDSQGRTCTKTVSAKNPLQAGRCLELKISSLDMKFEPVLSVNHEEISVGPDASSTTLMISTNENWSIQSDATWLSLSATSGSYDANVTISINANSAYSQRTAKLVITAGSLSKTINVIQAAAVKPMYAYSSTINNAADLSDNTMYVVRFASNVSSPTYNYNVWSVEDGTGKLKIVYNSNVNNASGNAIEYNQVFVFEKDSSDPGVASPYKSKIAGYLKCKETGKYLKSDMTFTANSKNDAQLLSFANKYGTDTTQDIDIYQRGTSNTLYYGSDYYMYTGSVNEHDGYRKWIFQSVYRIN